MSPPGDDDAAPPAAARADGAVETAAAAVATAVSGDNGAGCNGAAAAVLSPADGGGRSDAEASPASAALAEAAQSPRPQRSGKTRAKLREALQSAEEQLRRAREAVAAGSGDGARAMAEEAEAALREVEAQVQKIREARTLSPVMPRPCEGDADNGRRRVRVSLEEETRAAADDAAAALLQAAAEAAADDDASTILADCVSPHFARTPQPFKTEAGPGPGPGGSPGGPQTKAQLVQSLMLAETQLSSMQAKALGPAGIVDAAGAKAEAARLQEMLAMVEEQVKQLTALREAGQANARA